MKLRESTFRGSPEKPHRKGRRFHIPQPVKKIAQIAVLIGTSLLSTVNSAEHRPFPTQETGRSGQLKLATNTVDIEPASQPIKPLGPKSRLVALEEAKKHLKKDSAMKLTAEDDVAVAVRNTDNFELKYIIIRKNGELSDAEFEIMQVARRKGNMRYVVLEPANYTVIAVKKRLKGGSAVKTPIFVVTEQSAKELDENEMERFALDYLDALNVKAILEIEKRKITDPFNTKDTVKQEIPADILMVLAITEHMYGGKLDYETARASMKAVLVQIAMNQELAYRNSVSPAGARGLFQIMRATYANIRKLYPKAHLTPDFVKGMEDHLNSAIASILLNICNLESLKKYKNTDRLSAYELGQMLAYAYNRGSFEEVRNGKYLRNDYVIKFSVIWRIYQRMMRGEV